MANQEDLFGKTYDQQMQATRNQADGDQLLPNRRVGGETVFEPLLNGIRVTARDSQHRVLWGFVGSEDMLNLTHVPVAIYENLRTQLRTELSNHGLPAASEPDPMKSAERALSALEKAIAELRQSITVKKVSDQTRMRACSIARAVEDARRMIRLEVTVGKVCKDGTSVSGS